MTLATSAQHGSDAAPRHAVVTGGGRGIGAAVAQALAAKGLRITVLGRNLPFLESLCAVDPSRFHAAAADITQADQVDEALRSARARFGPVDVLVNNAGQAVSAPFLKTGLEVWHQMHAVNLMGTVICTQAVLPDMLLRGWGRVVHIASTAGQKGYAYVSAYCAAKHAIIGLTRALALEVAAKGVTVNAVCPGYTDTDIVRDSVRLVVEKTGRAADDALAEFTRANPQGRLVLPAEVAHTVAWLCDPLTGAITGQSISISGGEVM